MSCVRLAFTYAEGFRQPSGGAMFVLLVVCNYPVGQRGMFQRQRVYVVQLSNILCVLILQYRESNTTIIYYRHFCTTTTGGFYNFSAFQRVRIQPSYMTETYGAVYIYHTYIESGTTIMY
jgi:hypothetical protein